MSQVWVSVDMQFTIRIVKQRKKSRQLNGHAHLGSAADVLLVVDVSTRSKPISSHIASV